MGFQIYLGGAMSGLSFQEQNEWRAEIKKELETHYCDYIVKCINPVDYYNTFDPTGYDSDIEVMKFDLHKLKHSDLIIMNFNNMKSIGSNIELGVAYENNIPVIGLNESKQQLHPWHYCVCNKVFDDMDDMLIYIKEYYLD
jgi:nucleoside 2-deoxyribosyltransferase